MTNKQRRRVARTFDIEQIKGSLDIIIYNVDMASQREYTAIRAEGPQKYLDNLLQQLQWLSACFQTGRQGKVSTSISELQKTDVGLQVTMNPPEAVSEQSCWHSLLPGITIAAGFPIPARTSDAQKGIELPFYLMIKLAMIWYPLELQGGVILKGYSTALIPMARYQDAVQWHYMAIEGDGEELTMEQLEEHSNLFVKGYSLEEMSKMRSFLGLFDDARVVACTKRIKFTNFKPSGSEFARRFLSMERAATLTAGFSKLALASVSMKWQLPKEPRVRVVDRQKVHLEALIRGSEKQVTLIYDETAEMGWMIPENCAILYLALCLLAELMPRSTIFDELPLATADHEWDATKTFNLLKTIKLKEKYGNESDWFMSDEIKRILIAFQERRESRTDRNNEAFTFFENRSKMRAWDVTELIRGELDVQPRVVQVPGTLQVPMSRVRDWPSIQRDSNTLILCGKDFGELIQASSTNKLCAHRVAPIHHHNGNLLVTVRSIKLATSKCTGRNSMDDPMLGKGLYCHRAERSQLFRPCSTDEHSCNMLQELSTEPPSAEQRLNLDERPNGAVLFGPAVDTNSDVSMHAGKVLKLSRTCYRQAKGHQTTGCTSIDHQLDGENEG